MCAGSMHLTKCLGLYAHSISDVRLAINQIGVFNPSSWNSPRVRASKGWEARNDGGGRLFAIGFRSNLCRAVAS